LAPNSERRGREASFQSVGTAVLFRRLIFLSLFFSSSLSLAGIQTGNFTRAEELYRLGKLREAEGFYAAVAPGDVNYPPALLRLGTIYYATARATLAEAAFKKYLKIRESAEVYTLLAGAEFNLKKFEEAYASAKQAVRLDPHYAKAYTALGMIYTAIGDWPDSEAAYRQSLRLNSEDPDTWYMMGRGYFLRNEFAKAKDAFETALKLSPQRIRNYENLALTREVMGDDRGAEEVLRRGVEVNHTLAEPDVRIVVAYGAFLFKHERNVESLAALREAVKLAPGDSEAHYELARVLFRMKQLESAAEEGEAASRTGLPDYKVHYLLSRIYTAMGNTQAAARHADQAARLADNPPRNSR